MTAANEKPDCPCCKTNRTNKFEYADMDGRDCGCRECGCIWNESRRAQPALDERETLMAGGTICVNKDNGDILWMMGHCPVDERHRVRFFRKGEPPAPPTWARCLDCKTEWMPK